MLGVANEMFDIAPCNGRRGRLSVLVEDIGKGISTTDCRGMVFLARIDEVY